MDGKSLDKAKSIFGGVFPIWPLPARSWNSSAEKSRSPNHDDADRLAYRSERAAASKS
jgi:hypothetical protein